MQLLELAQACFNNLAGSFVGKAPLENGQLLKGFLQRVIKPLPGIVKERVRTLVTCGDITPIGLDRLA